MCLYPVSEQSRNVLTVAGLGHLVGGILPNPIVIPPVPTSVSFEGDVRIGFVGSSSPRKGLHLLTEIASQLRLEPVRWVIFGVRPDGGSTYVEACMRQLKASGVDERIEWAGVTKDLDATYRRMDVLLVPSLRESWCRVAMEGMASGLPVVGTDIEGMSEIFRRVPSAPTFSVNRPDLGGRQVLKLVHDASLRSSIGREGRDAMREFDADLIADQLLGLYAHRLGGVEAA